MSENDESELNIRWTKPGWTASEEEVSLYFTIFFILLGIVLILSKQLHTRPKLNAVLPEAGMTILVGMFAGAIVRFVAPPFETDDDSSSTSNPLEALLSFSATIFFIALLPPIIFNAGYTLRRELFFRYIQPIFLLSCVGTTLSTMTIGCMLKTASNYGLTGNFNPSMAEVLTFGALISTTDTVSVLAVLEQKRVDPHLFYLIFGESALNDAVGLVLFNACGKHVGFEEPDSTLALVVSGLNIVFDVITVFLGSMMLGALSGISSALLLKWIDMRQSHLLELSLYVLIMYFPFFVAEELSLSGIVAIFFTGMSAKQYAMPNLTAKTDNDADALFRCAAFIAETVIFLEMGLSTFGFSNLSHVHYKFIIWALFASLVGRACGVYPVAFVFNRLYKRVRQLLFEDISSSVKTSIHEKPYVPDLKISWTNCHMLWLAGLRGAVAYACSKNFPNANGNRQQFVITTITIVLVTVFIFGGLTEPALKYLNVPMYIDEDEYMRTYGKWVTKGWFYNFEKKYIDPCVLRNYPTATQQPSIDENVFHELKDSHEERLEIQSIEMTELGHLGIVKRMEIEKQIEFSQTIKENIKQRRSIYDYGLAVNL